MDHKICAITRKSTQATQCDVSTKLRRFNPLRSLAGYDISSTQLIDRQMYLVYKDIVFDTWANKVILAPHCY